MDRVSAAQYALLVIYAWDMFDGNRRTLTPPPDPRILADGWTVAGYISAADDIAATALDGGGKAATASGSVVDRVCYGYVATKGQECVVAIRGTDSAWEWADDAECVMEPHPTTAGGLVDSGFFGIFRTMQFVSLQGVGSDVVAGISAVAGTRDVMVLGHSLGSSLATYLALKLNQQSVVASACMFASPKTGDSTWVQFFETHVQNYDVFNYERDVVPKVPLADVLHFSAYHQLLQAKTIPAANASAVIEDNPGCNHHLICYIALLDPPTYRKAMAAAGVQAGDKTNALCVKSVSP